MKQQDPAITPARILEMQWGFAASSLLVTAVELGVFDHLADGKRTAAELARATRSSRRGVRMVADALTAFGLLKKNSDAYQLTPVAEAFLLKNGAMYLGGFISHAKDLWKVWSTLTDSVRTGRPQQSVNDQPRAEEFFPRLVRQLFPTSYRTGSLAADEFGKRGIKVSCILDVAAGSAAWSIPFAERNPKARVTALDFPTVLEVARDFTRIHRVEQQYDFMPGSLRQLDFGRQRYDLIILGHICHSEGEKPTKKLLQKCYRALEPGGHLLIAELLPDDRRREAAIPLLFALNMLLNTDEGDVFTLAEYKTWLKASGFRKISPVHVNSAPWPLILAVK